MSHPLEYAVAGAWLRCDHGTAPGQFIPLSNQSMRINGVLVSNEFDKLPVWNIPSCGTCALDGLPCMPVPVAWMDTFKVKVAGGRTLIYRSYLPCSKGGTVTFLTSGQVPISPEEMAEMVAEATPPEEEGWGKWDTAELTPVVGNYIGMWREGKEGNWGMFGMNLGFAVVDVFTLGAGSAVTTPIKGGAKATVKLTLSAGAKALLKKASTKLLELTTKKLDDLLKVGRKVIVYGCFPAGTKVATEFGLRNIEDVGDGDRVWAYDERNGQELLREVTNPIQRTVHATVRLEIADETITTTAEHPFYTRNGWCDAADLTPEDELVSRDGHWHPIRSVNFGYDETVVYNFNVQDLHSYFIGEWGWVAHNATKCLFDAFDAALRNGKEWGAWASSARNALAKNLLTKGTGMHAHHVIPLEHLRNMPIVQQAYRNGFDMNGITNGRALRPWEHIGKRGADGLQHHHSSYNKYARETIERMSKRYPNLSPEDLLTNKVVPHLNSKIDEALEAGESINDYMKDLL